MHQKYGATAYIPAGASSAAEMTTLVSSSSEIEILKYIGAFSAAEMTTVASSSSRIEILWYIGVARAKVAFRVHETLVWNTPPDPPDPADPVDWCHELQLRPSLHTRRGSG